MKSLLVKSARPKGVATARVLKEVNGEMVEVRRYTPSSNAVTNNFMSEMFSGGAVDVFYPNQSSFGLFRTMKVGTGTSPITHSSNSLTSPANAIAWQGAPEPITAEDIGGIWYLKIVVDYTFPLGGLNGSYTEFGTFKGAEPNLMTGGLFKDTAGDPVAVSVADDEQLVVSYTVYFPTPSDVDPTFDRNDTIDYPLGTSTVNVNGTDYDAVIGVRIFKTWIISGGLRLIRMVTAEENDLLYEISIGGAAFRSNSPHAVITGSKTTTATSATWDVTATLASSSGITEVSTLYVGDRNRGELVINFDTPVPIPAGHSFTFSLNYTIDWSQ